MRLGTCLLYESHTLQGAHPEPADFCSALVADFYAAVDNFAGVTWRGGAHEAVADTLATVDLVQAIASIRRNLETDLADLEE